MAGTSPQLDLAKLRRQVDELEWYHTFELPGGIVTPGLFDHRKVVGKLPIPADLTGKRCLDAASSDGFFAFELARRGAAEVYSVDLMDASRQDWQRAPLDQVKASRGSGRAATAFEVVRDALGLDVKRVDLSLYDISPETLDGPFDFIFLGNILLHLADPGRALRALRSVAKPDGVLLSFEAISMPMTILRPRTPSAQLWHEDHAQWWTPNMAGHKRIVHAGGWDITSSGGPLFQPLGDHKPRWPKRIPWRPRDIVYWTCTRRFGGATAWALARPAPT